MSKMKFIATIDGEEKEVHVDNHGADDGFYTMKIGERSFHVDAQLMKSNLVSLLINNTSYDVDVEKLSKEPLDGRMAVRVRGRVVRLDMLDERRQKMKDAQQSAFAVGGKAIVESPMPGKIVKILVGEGEEVTQGQGVIVVEAMKMENELKAPKDGVVAEVRAKEGETIEGGAPLVLIE